MLLGMCSIFKYINSFYEEKNHNINTVNDLEQKSKVSKYANQKSLIFKTILK